MNNKKALKLLVVDDEPFMRTVVEKILSFLGYYSVDVVSNGQEALGHIARANPSYDVMICDLNMPDMDGVELMRCAGEEGFDGAVILLSGEDQRMLDATLDLARAFHLHVLGALQKPLKPVVLGELLDNYVPRRLVKDKAVSVAPIAIAEMKEALASAFVKELTLVYQPKIEVKTGDIVGMESLARWHHQTRGVLGPQAFIPLAEKFGLIDDVSKQLYRKALQQTAEWLSQGFDLKCSINFCINSFSSPGFADYLVSTAAELGVPPERIILEITETQVMVNMLNCLEVVMRLRLKKFNLSIDDFGTGNSSLTQLKKIPFNELKLDHYFVRSANHHMAAQVILESSVELGKKLGMTLVAEGVETREDWDMVEKIGCDIVQGYYCAKPLPAEEFSKLLRTWDGPHGQKIPAAVTTGERERLAKVAGLRV